MKILSYKEYSKETTIVNEGNTIKFKPIQVNNYAIQICDNDSEYMVNDEGEIDDEFYVEDEETAINIANTLNAKFGRRKTKSVMKINSDFWR